MKVLWLGQPQLKTTWVAASSLPATAIEEYENGVATEAITIPDHSYGQVSSTLSVTRQSKIGPDSKCAKTIRPVVAMAEG